MIVEIEGPKVDAVVFERMSAEDAELVKQELALPDRGGDEFFERDDVIWLDEPADERAEELARLNEELVDCRRRQRAFEAYLAALGVLACVVGSGRRSSEAGAWQRLRRCLLGILPAPLDQVVDARRDGERRDDPADDPSPGVEEPEASIGPGIARRRRVQHASPDGSHCERMVAVREPLVRGSARRRP